MNLKLSSKKEKRTPKKQVKVRTLKKGVSKSSEERFLTAEGWKRRLK